MLKEIDEKGTQVDVVLNNAGLQIGYRVDYLKTPLDDFPISFSVNTIAPMQICYHFLSGMIERGFGRVVGAFLSDKNRADCSVHRILQACH